MSHRRKNIVTQVGKHYHRGCITQQHKLGNIVAQVKKLLQDIKHCHTSQKTLSLRLENTVTQILKHCHTSSKKCHTQVRKHCHTS